MALREKFDHTEYTSMENMLGENLEQAIAGGLQDIFSDASSKSFVEKPERPLGLSTASPTGIFDPGQGMKNIWPVPPKVLSLQNNDSTDIVNSQRVNESPLTDPKGEMDHDQSQH
jgi:hypothetical protein